MDIKQKYREELNKEPYCQTKTGSYVKSGSYSDEYVKWLEKQLSISRVVDSKRRLQAWDNGYSQGYEDGEKGKPKHKDLGVY